MATYICKRCGKQFDLVGKSNYCWDCRHRATKCVICGKDIIQTNPEHDVLTCCRKCWGEWRKQSGQGKAVAAKSISTKIEKYGNAGYAERKPKICKFCGKEFIPRGSKQVYCDGPHYGQCPICGKQVLVKDPSSGPVTCSEECRVKAIVSTARKNDSYAKGLVKNRQTCLERYGVEHYSQTSEWSDKVQSTNRQKYGTDWAMQDTSLREKTAQTNIEKYGVDNPFKSAEIQEKIKQTNVERYGGQGTASQKIRSKIEATNLEKYGDTSPSRVLQCKEKSKLTCRDRYGFDSFASSKEGIAQRMKDPSKIDEFWNFREDPRKYVESHYSVPPYVDELAREIGVNETSIYDILIQHNCKEVIDRTRTSLIEREVHDFLLTLVPEEDIVWCDHRTIPPLELDLYLPAYKFAIECNPTYTHNSSFPSFGDTAPKSTVYHRDKTNACEAKGIFLMHIFGYDWTFKQEVIKSMIRSAINKSSRTIFARNTCVKEIDSKTASDFLSKNHRQGAVSSPIRLGLLDKESGDLVSLMTFGRLRNTIGKGSSSDHRYFELVRFCSLLNTSVVGGASKLFKHFLTIASPKQVMSFSDRAHTRGNLYSLLGFKEVSRSDPGYVWVNVQTEEYKNRVACQKHNLPNVFDDVTEEDMSTKSENDIMIEHGYAKVYDSGVIRWEYTPEESEAIENES